MVGPKAGQWEMHLLMKGSLSLNAFVRDLINLLYYGHNLQKHKNIFTHLSCMELVLHLIKLLYI